MTKSWKYLKFLTNFGCVKHLKNSKRKCKTKSKVFFSVLNSSYIWQACKCWYYSTRCSLNCWMKSLRVLGMGQDSWTTGACVFLSAKIDLLFFSGTLEIIYWFWDWAGRNWKNTEPLPAAAAANTACQGTLTLAAIFHFTLYSSFGVFTRVILNDFLELRICCSLGT